MSRNLSPTLRRELENLEKDSESRKSALKALKSYVKDLDTQAIPFFLAQVSGTKDAGSSSGEYAISLFEVLARTHGPHIVSQIDIIMDTIIKTLASGGGSFPLQQACSKVIPAIARYGMKPTTPEDKKKLIIHKLCMPLSNSLLGTQESLSCGAALCLKALVDCDNWKFASNEIVYEVCQKAAGALKDNITNMNSHMGLVMSLAKRNSLAVEDYAGILIQSALQVLNVGADERNSQKRLAAIQMINYLMKCLDIRSIAPELEMVVEEMEKCQSDPMPYVSGAAFEALHTAKRLMSEESKFDADVISESGSNFSMSHKNRGRYPSVSGGGSSYSISPESQTLSFADNDSFLNSSISTCQASCNRNEDNKHRNSGRKLWNYENGSVDRSLRDGLFSEARIRSGSFYNLSENGEGSDPRTGCTNGYTGSRVGTPNKEGLGSHNSSPQRSRSQIKKGGITIYNTPRRLVRSLQDEDDENTDFFYARKPRSLRIPHSVECGCSLSNGVIQTSINENMKKKSEESQNEAESVSSSDEVPGVESDVLQGSEPPVFQGNKIEQKKQVKNLGFRAAVKLFLAISFVLIALFIPVLLFGAEDEGYVHVVPT